MATEALRGVRPGHEACTGCALCAQICPENAILPVKDAATKG